MEHEVQSRSGGGASQGRSSLGTADAAGQRFRHDLRQPLVTASLLLEDVANMPAVQNVAVARLREAQRQLRAALDMLRVEELMGPAVDLVEIGAAIFDEVTSCANPCEVQLDRRRPAHVLVEPVGLLRTTRNLLDNAVHAATSTPGDALVRVVVDRQRDHAVLRVDDSGPGFGNVPARHGLGLVSVRRFAERWGGTLVIASSPLGGARVDLRLPHAVL